jgi:hypothetical protein
MSARRQVQATRRTNPEKVSRRGHLRVAATSRGARLRVNRGHFGKKYEAHRPRHLRQLGHLVVSQC